MTCCICQRHYVSPRCPVHGIGKRYIANLIGLVALVIASAFAVVTAADAREARPVPLVVCDVFGRYCDQALAVSWCESRWHTDARNGQYLGLFQMGAWERRQYGHGPDAVSQARAAWRYFNATGRTWRPWSCRWAA